MSSNSGGGNSFWDDVGENLKSIYPTIHLSKDLHWDGGFFGWLFLIFAIILSLQLWYLLVDFLRGCWKQCLYLFPSLRRDLLKRYGGEGTWAVITGPDGGQARVIALELAQKGFNLLLLGYPECNDVKEECLAENESIDVRVLVCDFSNAARDEENFFEPIQAEFDQIDVGLMVNAVGHRFAWNPTHEMPRRKLYDVIAVGAVVQTRLTNMAIEKFEERYTDRGLKSGMVSITAMCQMQPAVFGVGQLATNFNIPYVTIYEAANAFGFFHANGIYDEYRRKGWFDCLNITPGAVYTENTEEMFHRSIWFSVCGCSVEVFGKNIVALMGNWNGNSVAHWRHGAGQYFVNIFCPIFGNWLRRLILWQAGNAVATDVMEKTKQGIGLYQGNSRRISRSKDSKSAEKRAKEAAAGSASSSSEDDDEAATDESVHS
jgi:short-subunit dehydrogenase